MRRVDWRDPNFRVTITDTQDRSCEELHAADLQSDLEAELQARVDLGLIASYDVKPYDFSGWKTRAANATADAIAAKVVAEGYQTLGDAKSQAALEDTLHEKIVQALVALFTVAAADLPAWELRARKALDNALADRRDGKKFDFNSNVWGDLKDYLRVLFHGKCAYCDGRFDRNDWGDVEHYRPKRKVTDANGQAIDHPGYYWLAYQMSNLLPSCKLCNQGKGKANQFPIDPEDKRVKTPLHDLAGETPLLLNPYIHNPADHLRYVARMKEVAEKSLGTIESKDSDPVGENSKKVYWLNRPALIEFRRKLQGDVRLRVKMAYVDEKPTVIAELITDCLEGKEEFSGSVYAEVMSYLDFMDKAHPRGN